MSYVLDACAVIAFLRKEPGADIVGRIILTGSAEIHAINLYEVYYDFLRAADAATAAGSVTSVIAMGVMVTEEMPPALWQDAARIKVVYRMSLADSFAVALTRRRGAELVTSDHKELDPVAAAGVCKVSFFR